jgi:hypothetical protein
MERDGKPVFTETKGGSRIVKTHELPILPPLCRGIDAAPIRHLVYQATAFGWPHAVKAFGNWFKRRCREEGLDDGLSAYGVQKLGAQRCAETGAVEHQLSAPFGLTTTRQAAVYTRKPTIPSSIAGRRGCSRRKCPTFPAMASRGTTRPKGR